jgi:pimeloyl-ACP methyl ester carboxylesterase
VIVLVHAGVCDARMWDGFDLPGATRHELRGFGRTPLPPAGEFSHADDLIEALKGEPAALVGASYGGWVCLQAAAKRPELVTDLILLDAAFPDHNWSQEILDYSNEEEALLEQGDFRGAAILNAGFWLQGDEHRDRVIAMQERAFELEAESEAESVEPESVDLGAIGARTLVAVGEHDKRDFHEIAERLARGIAGAGEVVTIEGAGHLPALERPNETAALVKEFLGRP